jgi:redox-sensitive bicupin YhaK (pirin superfamily)
MIDVRRATDRYRAEQPGITSWHCFSAGSYFDPDNVAFGRVVACDEHVVAPGAGFDDHPHAGVELISWVLDGTLAHWDSAGRRHLVAPGSVQYQRAGGGIRHAERNASMLEPLRFVQCALLVDAAEPAYRIDAPPLELENGTFDVVTRARATRVAGSLVHLFVAAGNFHASGTDLAPGDSLRTRGPLDIDGDGQLLVVTVEL